MNKLKLIAKSKLLIVLLSVLLVSLTGCSGQQKYEQMTGYTVRLSDGWVSAVFHCEAYEILDQRIKCFDKENKLVREDFMTSDVRVTVKAN